MAGKFYSFQKLASNCKSFPVTFLHFFLQPRIKFPRAKHTTAKVFCHEWFALDVILCGENIRELGDYMKANQGENVGR